MCEKPCDVFGSYPFIHQIYCLKESVIDICNRQVNQCGQFIDKEQMPLTNTSKYCRYSLSDLPFKYIDHKFFL